MTSSPPLVPPSSDPRIRVAPPAKTNSWQEVVAIAEILGVKLDPWQELVLQAACGERADYRWAANVVGLSVPRQNGKTLLLAVRAVCGAILFNERKIIVSAHMQDTAREVFNQINEWIDDVPALAKRIAPGGVYTSITREEIRFTNGVRIEFKSRRKGRGLSGDLVLLDEAQILSRESWAKVNSARSARPNPQAWLTGTPPTPQDDGAVFQEVRDKAIAGQAMRAGPVAYLEWAAEPDDDPEAEETRARANPAWHTRINLDVVESEYATYSPGQFARERLGIWDEVVGVKPWRIIAEPDWQAAAVDAAGVPVSELIAYGVKFSSDGELVGLAVAVKDDDGRIHLESLGVDMMPSGARRLVPWLAGQAQPVAVDGASGAGDFRNQLIAAGLPPRKVVVLKTSEAIDAHAGLLRALDAGEVTHFDQEGVNLAVAALARRKIGQGFGWKSANDDVDITPLDAVTLAHWRAEQLRNPRPRKMEWR